MKVKVLKTMRRDGNTHLKDKILEIEDMSAEKLIKKGVVIPLDKDLAEALEGNLKKEIVKEVEVKVPISYEEMSKFTHEELDAVAEVLKVEVDGKKEEKLDTIWEHLSGGYLEEDTNA
jgi:hypothetical protein